MLDHKFTNSRLYRWSLLLSEYDFSIIHKPGKQMIAADVISRKNEVRKPQNILIAHIEFERQGLFSKQRLSASQNSVKLKTTKEKLVQGNYKGMFLANGIIKKLIGDKQIYVIDEDYCREVLKFIHTYFNHIGSRKCWLIFREEF